MPVITTGMPLSIAPVLWHALHPPEPGRIAADRRAHGVRYVEVRKVLPDVRRSGAKGSTVRVVPTFSENQEGSQRIAEDSYR